MRIEKLYRLYVQDLRSLYGWNRPSPAPVETRQEWSLERQFIEQQAQRLDQVFEWLGQPPALPRLKTQEER